MNYVTEKHYLKIIESTIKGCQRYHLYKKETIEDQICDCVTGNLYFQTLH
jgi:hypothetical protein